MPNSVSQGLHLKFVGTFADRLENSWLTLPVKLGTGALNADTDERLTSAGSRPRPPPPVVAGFSSTVRPLGEVLMYAANSAASATRLLGASLVTALVELPQLALAFAPAVDLRQRADRVGLRVRLGQVGVHLVGGSPGGAHVGGVFIVGDVVAPVGGEVVVHRDGLLIDQLAPVVQHLLLDRPVYVDLPGAVGQQLVGPGVGKKEQRLQVVAVVDRGVGQVLGRVLLVQRDRVRGVGRPGGRHRQVVLLEARWAGTSGPSGRCPPASRTGCCPG